MSCCAPICSVAPGSSASPPSCGSSARGRRPTPSGCATSPAATTSRTRGSTSTRTSARPPSSRIWAWTSPRRRSRLRGTGRYCAIRARQTSPGRWGSTRPAGTQARTNSLVPGPALKIETAFGRTPRPLGVLPSHGCESKIPGRETVAARGMKLLLGGSVRGRPYGRATGIGAFWENVVGQAVLGDGLRARACSVVAPATCPVALRARIRRCRLPAFSRVNDEEEVGVETLGRAIGLDVHLEFCEVAIVEGGVVRSAGRIETSPEQVELFAQSLGREDRVALEVTGSAWEIARILEPHVARVVVVSPNETGIRQARAKTDRLDARTLARLLWGGELDAVWVPDQQTRVLRRRLARREQLVRARSRAKNEVHAVLMRCLKGKPPFSDLFGVKARKWLAELELPVEEAETVA